MLLFMFSKTARSHWSGFPLAFSTPIDFVIFLSDRSHWAEDFSLATVANRWGGGVAITQFSDVSSIFRS